MEIFNRLFDVSVFRDIISIINIIYIISICTKVTNLQLRFAVLISI